MRDALSASANCCGDSASPRRDRRGVTRPRIVAAAQTAGIRRILAAAYSGPGSLAIATFLQGRPQGDALPAIAAALELCDKPNLREALLAAEAVCERSR